MRKFIITSPAFDGEAALMYDDTGRLITIDMRDAAMECSLVQQFKAMVPAHIDDLQKTFATTRATIVEADYEVTFEMFYKDYPHKRNRYKVQKAWDKLNKTDQVKAHLSLAAYKKYLQRKDWLNAMIGDRYLRDREYETDWNKL